MAEITVYGAPWRPDCRRAKQFLAEHRVEYDRVDLMLGTTLEAMRGNGSISALTLRARPRGRARRSVRGSPR